MSKMPLKSLRTALGVKMNPFAKVFNIISKLMQRTKVYSAI